LARRQEELYQRYRKAWVRALPRWTRQQIRFERGFPGTLAGHVPKLVGDLHVLLGKAPLRHLGVYSFTPAVLPQLTEALAGGRLRSLYLNSSHSDSCLGESGAEALAGAAFLAGLHALDLRYQAILDRGLGALLKGGNLGGLRGLGLVGNGLSPTGAEELARATDLAGLTFLELLGNRLQDAGVDALAGAGPPAKLRLLRLTRNNRAANAVGRLTGAAFWGRLEFLYLGMNPLGDPGVCALAAGLPSGSPARLRVLYLNQCECGDAGAVALAGWPGLSAL